GALRVRLVDRDDWDDVGGADARMRSPVLAQVDPLAGAGDPGQERGNDLLLAADERVDGAVVVRVAVDIEQPCVPGERVADGVDRPCVTPLGEVRDGLERQHRSGAYAAPRGTYGAHSSQTDGGTRPSLIPRKNALQPTQRPNPASREANTAITPTSA